MPTLLSTFLPASSPACCSTASLPGAAWSCGPTACGLDLQCGVAAGATAAVGRRRRSEAHGATIFV